MYEQAKSEVVPPVRVTVKMMKALRSEAKRNKVKLSAVVRQALTKHLGL